MDINRLLAEADPARDVAIPDADWPAARQAFSQLAESPPSLTRSRRPRSARRLTAVATASAGIAAALALALTAAPGALSGHHAAPAGGRGGTGSQGVSFGPADSAAGVLHNAALAALQLPAYSPRPNQFVYTKLYTTDTTRSGGAGLIQTWTSVSGTRFGFVKGAYDTPVRGEETSACVNGRYKQAPGAPPLIGSHNCNAAAFAGYLPDLPTGDSAALANYLRKTFGITPGSSEVYADQLVFLIGHLMDTNYLTSAQRAALYSLLAETPGLTVVHHVRNIEGTAGVGVRATFLAKGQYNIVVFNPKTYASLGMVYQQPSGRNLRRTAKFGEVLLTEAIVGKAGQLP